MFCGDQSDLHAFVHPKNKINSNESNTLLLLRYVGAFVSYAEI